MFDVVGALLLDGRDASHERSTQDPIVNSKSNRRIEKHLIRQAFQSTSRSWRHSWWSLINTILAVIAIIIVGWLCTVLGVITNTGLPKESYVHVLDDGRRVQFVRTTSFWDEQYFWGIDVASGDPTESALRDLSATASLPTWGPLSQALQGKRDGLVMTAYQRAAGLPLRAMTMNCERDDNGTMTYSWTWRPELLAQILGWKNARTGIPLGILPTRFLLNLGVYWLLISSVQLLGLGLRGCHRIRWGRCPICSYEMMDRLLLDGCPECGWSRRVRPVAA